MVAVGWDLRELVEWAEPWSVMDSYLPRCVVGLLDLSSRCRGVDRETQESYNIMLGYTCVNKCIVIVYTVIVTRVGTLYDWSSPRHNHNRPRY